MSTYAKEKFSIPLPWHTRLWKQWYQAAQRNKLPHALLLTAPLESGKTEFIKSFSQLMLCFAPIQKKDICQSCNKCPACCWYIANTHPNYFEVTANQSDHKHIISTEEIRGLTQALQQTHKNTHASVNKHPYHTLVVINALDALHVSAQHALLKTLEEPVPGVLFIVATTRSYALMPTIRSRCQCHSLPQPTVSECSDWLRSLLPDDYKVDNQQLVLCTELAHHLPFRALEIIKNEGTTIYYAILASLVDLSTGRRHPGEVAEQWTKHPTERLLDYLMHSLSYFICLKLKTVPLAEAGTASATQINHLTTNLPFTFLFDYWDTLQNIRRETQLYALNTLIVLEKLAYQFSNSCNLA